MIKITIALSYATSYGLTFEDFIKTAHSLAFEEVQLIPDQEPNLYSELNPTRVRAIREAAKDAGVSISVHNIFYDINLVSLVPAVRRAAIDITYGVLDFAHAVGANSVVVHPGYMFGGWRRDDVQRQRFWNNAVEALSDVAILSKEYSIPILIENGSYYLCTASGPDRVPLHLGITPRELRDLIDLSGGLLRVSLDINKAIRSGHPIKEFLELNGDYIDQLQLSTAVKHVDVIREVLTTLDSQQRHLAMVLEGSLDEAREARELLWRIEREW